MFFFSEFKLAKNINFLKLNKIKIPSGEINNIPYLREIES